MKSLELGRPSPGYNESPKSCLFGIRQELRAVQFLVVSIQNLQPNSTSEQDMQQGVVRTEAEVIRFDGPLPRKQEALCFSLNIL